MRPTLYDIMQDTSQRVQKSVKIALCWTECIRFSMAEWEATVNTAVNIILTL